MSPLIKRERVQGDGGAPRPITLPELEETARASGAEEAGGEPELREDGTATPPEAGEAPAAEDGFAEPAPPERAAEVRLLRAGAEVRGIELRCSCGETTVLEIEYESPSEETPA